MSSYTQMLRGIFPELSDLSVHQLHNLTLQDQTMYRFLGYILTDTLAKGNSFSFALRNAQMSMGMSKKMYTKWRQKFVDEFRTRLILDGISGRRAPQGFGSFSSHR